jgi:D-alanyl-lipoteichoic acid acyltransferase DltB (MBOAT superfamily)
LAEACSAIGIHLDPITLHLVLPVGISFYTFQALSYTIDVYKRKIEPTHDIIAFFAFISFFPQLVAGPIERATNLLPQFYRVRTFEYDKAVDGCRQMLWGFFKKMVVADNCATAVNEIWNNYQQASGFTLLLGGILFTFQIYGDFSGYSDIAIGTARLFGFNLMRNFRFPYFSRDIAEFWRRWHISLTTWFRDYIYIPLGGSRCAKWKVMRNTLIIFLVSGFWHGANWTFIIWGAYHALLFFPLMLFGLNRKYTGEVAEGRLLPSVKESFQMLLTFVLVVIGWIIFRAENIEQAWDYLNRMCSMTLFNIDLNEGKRAILYIFFMIIIEWIQRDKEHGLQMSANKATTCLICRWLIYLVISLSTLILQGIRSEFIYFQF